MTDAELEEIEACAKAATPGPWTSCPERVYVFAPDGHMVTESRGYGAEKVGQRPEGAGELNAEFIAHAREDVPALIAEVKRLRNDNAYSMLTRLKAENAALREAAQSAQLLLHKLDHIGDALEEDGLCELDAFDNVASILSQSDARELLRKALAP